MARRSRRGYEAFAIERAWARGQTTPQKMNAMIQMVQMGQTSHARSSCQMELATKSPRTVASGPQSAMKRGMGSGLCAGSQGVAGSKGVPHLGQGVDVPVGWRPLRG